MVPRHGRISRATREGDAAYERGWFWVDELEDGWRSVLSLQLGPLVGQVWSKFFWLANMSVIDAALLSDNNLSILSIGNSSFETWYPAVWTKQNNKTLQLSCRGVGLYGSYELKVAEAPH
jgi:hypothetical protein